MAGLYIHIPFCKQKCHYCDFHFSVSQRNFTEMVHAINLELVMRKNEVDGAISSIYFGGGTPSLLPISSLESIFNTIYKHYTVADAIEITMESNPDNLNIDYVKSLKKTPVNRLSIGIQSFHENELQMMHRAHNVAEAIGSVKISQDVGFQNITIDLIYGMPKSSLDSWHENLNTFLSLNVPHLSSYALTVEPKTALAHFVAKGTIELPDDDLVKQQFFALRSFMLKNGFEHYEISNFALPNYQAQHNTSYWNGMAYIGIGPSAHSFSGKSRSWNIAHNSKYIHAIQDGNLPLEVEFLTSVDIYNEYVMTRLRTQWGIDLTEMSAKFGLTDVTFFLEKANPFFQKKQLVYYKKSKVRISENALFLMDGIISELFQIG